MSYHCELAAINPQPALTVRSRVPVHELPDMFERSYIALIEYLENLGEDVAGPPFAIYYNVDMEDLDVEAGFPVTKELPGKDSIRSTTIDVEKAAYTLHTGSYSDIESAYLALMEWMNENGHEPSGITYEFYLNDPGTTPQDKLQTEIFMPVKKVGRHNKIN